jgi:hypothetical protein
MRPQMKVRRTPLPCGVVDGVGGVGEPRMDWRTEGVHDWLVGGLIELLWSFGILNLGAKIWYVAVWIS